MLLDFLTLTKTITISIEATASTTLFDLATICLQESSTLTYYTLCMVLQMAIR